LLLRGIVTEDDWAALKQEIKFVYNTDNYFWDLKEAEILAERIKMLSIVEPYVGKYFSSEFIRRKILKQTDEEMQVIDQQMKIDIEKMRQQQMQQAMLQQMQAQTGQEQ
jgi:23S rRNA maturation mini-RNase III